MAVITYIGTATKKSATSAATNEGHLLIERISPMKTKVSISLLTLCLLSIITSAQGYSIRVASNTNLRASNSLSASIVETVPAGTTLTVLGEVNRWLRISRDGREVWMASWVRHERVEGGVQTQSQTTSTVDNCCFVDRQCQSDQEWTDGYWAFQNMQCAVPSQSQVQATSSSPSADASQIDNCCQADRQCQTDEDWINGYYAFQNSQCVALVQTQPQTTSQPAVSSPAQIDNCCFAGWQCSTDQEWANGYTAYQNNQCASHSQSQVLNVDLSQVDNCCFVNLQCQTDQDWEHGYAAYKYYQCSTDIPMKIDGSNTFVALFRSAFNLLKERSPRLYAYGSTDLTGSK